MPLLLTRSLPERRSQPWGNGVGGCGPPCDFQGEGRYMLVNNNKNHLRPLTQSGCWFRIGWAAGRRSARAQRRNPHPVGSGAEGAGPERVPRLGAGSPAAASPPRPGLPLVPVRRKAPPPPPRQLLLRRPEASGGFSCSFCLCHREKMKPHVTYHQLKTLHSPEEPPQTEQPSLAPKKDFRWILVVAILSTMLATALLFHMLILPFRGPTSAGKAAAAGPYLGNRCKDPCRSVLVESIPEGLTYDDNSTLNPSIFDAWKTLLGDASRSVDIASFYWTLSNKDTRTQDPSAGQGEEILAALRKVPGRGVTLRIAVNPPSSRMPCSDLQLLEESGAQIRKVDFPQLTGGVLHTKFWIVDQQHIFLGSANMDWRALTQVKELGMAVYNCSCLAQDLGKMFEAYWALGLPNATIPSPWPANYSTPYNKETPLELELNGTEAGVYFSSAPPALCATGRTEDLQSLVSIVDDADEFVHIEVMSYLPTMEFSHPKRFWPVIDDHLRKAAYERRVRVRLLVGCWRHSKANMFPFLRSLAAMHDNRTHYNMEVRLFVVPANETQARIPYARVNHSKFMVTDKVAYIGTSNWSGDYFLHTAGSALVVNQSHVGAGEQPTVRDRLQAVFERDWNSKYSQELSLPGQWEQLCGTY